MIYGANATICSLYVLSTSLHRVRFGAPADMRHGALMHTYDQSLNTDQTLNLIEYAVCQHVVCIRAGETYRPTACGLLASD